MKRTRKSLGHYNAKELMIIKDYSLTDSEVAVLVRRSRQSIYVKRLRLAEEKKFVSRFDINDLF